MSKTGALRHVHRYMRTRPRNEIIWKCMLPGCTHFIPLNITVIGRNSICWECGEVFTMEEHHLNQEMPKCDTCSTGIIQEVDVFAMWKQHQSKQKEKKSTMDEVVDEIEVINPIEDE